MGPKESGMEAGCPSPQCAEVCRLLFEARENYVNHRNCQLDNQLLAAAMHYEQCDYCQNQDLLAVTPAPAQPDELVSRKVFMEWPTLNDRQRYLFRQYVLAVAPFIPEPSDMAWAIYKMSPGWKN